MKPSKPKAVKGRNRFVRQLMFRGFNRKLSESIASDAEQYYELANASKSSKVNLIDKPDR